ncbi:MAG: hypothetical protein SPG64_01725 [Candidatus Enteromonas sp.]|nr:hypothetical protein [Candidatus Enteromonas sp.]
MKIEKLQDALLPYVNELNECIRTEDFFNSILFQLEKEDREEILRLFQRGMALPEAIEKVLNPLMDKDAAKVLQKAIQKRGLDEICLVTAEEIKEDPYFALLQNVPDAKWDGLFFEHQFVPAGTFFLLDDIRVDSSHHYREICPIGYAIDDLTYPVLGSNGVPWMSLCPHELRTMRKPIQEAKGKVAALGLGLGYYAFSVSQKDEVSEVHIYDLDRGIIEFFASRILPLFPHKEKIFIHEKDAFDFPDEGPFDTVFVDIFHNADDGLLPYLLFKNKEMKGTQFLYWIEPTLLAYYRRFVLDALMMYDAPLREIKQEDEIFIATYNAIKSIHPKDEKEAIRLLSENGLQTIIERIKKKI